MLATALVECYACVPACVSVGLLSAIQYVESDTEKRGKAVRRKLHRSVPQSCEEHDGARDPSRDGVDKGAILLKNIEGATDLDCGNEAECDHGGKAALDSEVLEQVVTPTTCPTPPKSVEAKADLHIQGFESVLGAANNEARAPFSNFEARLETPRSCASLGSFDTRSLHTDASQEIIDDLQRQIQGLTDELAKVRNRTPRSARSERSLKSDRSGKTDKSVRSEKSQRIIDELQNEIQKLQEERAKNKTPRSELSAASGKASVRSDTSERIIAELQAQIHKLKEDVREGDKALAALMDHPELGGHVEPLLRSLQLPEECDKILSREGIEFLDDLEDYTEVELVELGFKRAHAKRLLKAVAVHTAPDDSKFPSPVASI